MSNAYVVHGWNRFLSYSQMTSKAMRLPFSTPFHLKTTLDATTVSDRLRSGISRYEAARTSRVKGSISDDGCVLIGPIPLFMRNSFRRVLEIHFYPTANGTELRGRFRLSWPVFYFMCVWFGFLFVTTPIGLVVLVAQQGLSALAKEPELLVPVVMIVFGFGLVQTGVWLSRSSEEKVVEFLHQMLDQSQVIAKSVS